MIIICHVDVLFQCLVSLMARLAHNNIGYIDWSPYVDKVKGKSFLLALLTTKCFLSFSELLWSPCVCFLSVCAMILTFSFKILLIYHFMDFEKRNLKKCVLYDSLLKLLKPFCTMMSKSSRGSCKQYGALWSSCYFTCRWI